MYGFEDHVATQEGEVVEVVRMAPDEACTTDMLVMVR